MAEVKKEMKAKAPEPLSVVLKRAGKKALGGGIAGGGLLGVMANGVVASPYGKAKPKKPTPAPQKQPQGSPPERSPNKPPAHPTPSTDGDAGKQKRERFVPPLPPGPPPAAATARSATPSCRTSCCRAAPSWRTRRRVPMSCRSCRSPETPCKSASVACYSSTTVRASGLVVDYGRPASEGGAPSWRVRFECSDRKSVV